MPETKINTRSPFFVKYTQADIAKVVLDVYVYSGTKNTDKGTKVIQLIGKPIGDNDYVTFELSEIIKEYIEPKPTTPLNTNIDYVKWVQLESTIT